MWSTDKVMHTGAYGNYTYRQRGTKMVFKVMGSKVKVMSEKYISEGIWGIITKFEIVTPYDN